VPTAGCRGGKGYGKKKLIKGGRGGRGPSRGAAGGGRRGYPACPKRDWESRKGEVASVKRGGQKSLGGGRQKKTSHLQNGGVIHTGS